MLCPLNQRFGPAHWDGQMNLRGHKIISGIEENQKMFLHIFLLLLLFVTY